MDPSPNAAEPLPGHSEFARQLGAALRGGLILLACSVLWGGWVKPQGDSFAIIWFVWLTSAWVVFPAGAFLGCRLPQWMAGRGKVGAAGFAVLLGLMVGLILTAAFWLEMNHHELIGLMTNRNSGGYASYSFSVRQQLRREAWSALTVVAPITALWVAIWVIWTWRRTAVSPATPNLGRMVQLRFDWHLLRLVGWLTGGLALFAVSTLAIAALTVRGEHVPPVAFLLIAPGAAGLVVLGPWLGPLVNPGGGSGVAWQIVKVALPVLLLGLAPFILRRRPVRPGTATAAWCGFVTAWLFWIAAGAWSLGWSLG